MAETNEKGNEDVGKAVEVVVDDFNDDENVRPEKEATTSSTRLNVNDDEDNEKSMEKSPTNLNVDDGPKSMEAHGIGLDFVNDNNMAEADVVNKNVVEEITRHAGTKVSAED